MILRGILTSRFRVAIFFVALAPACWSTTALGALYVSNGGDGTIKAVSSTGAVSTYATGLSTPRGLAFDAANNLYVANNGDSTIQKITPGGAMTTFASGLSGYDLYGVAIDSVSGNIFVSAINLSNTSNSAILEFTPTGTMSTFATVPSPGGLVFDNGHNLFVTHALAGPNGEAEGGINEVSPLGVVTAVVPTGMSDPIGLARSAVGDLYAAERAGSMRILKATTGGSVTTFTTGVTSPYGLTFGTDGRLYAADFADGQIDAVTGTGTVSTFATGLSSPRFLTLGPDVPEPGSLALLTAGVALLSRASKRT